MVLFITSIAKLIQVLTLAGSLKIRLIFSKILSEIDFLKFYP